MKKGKSKDRAFRHNIKRLTEKAQARHRGAYDRQQYDKPTSEES